VANPTDAEDITQEIPLKIITKLSTYDHRKASFPTWLYRITANQVINMRKRGCEKGILSFQNHPFYDPPNVTVWLRSTSRQDKFEELFHLN